MSRRTHPREHKQRSKGLKRPRSWHRTSSSRGVSDYGPTLRRLAEAEGRM